MYNPVLSDVIGQFQDTGHAGPGVETPPESGGSSDLEARIQRLEFILQGKRTERDHSRTYEDLLGEYESIKERVSYLEDGTLPILELKATTLELHVVALSGGRDFCRRPDASK